MSDQPTTSRAWDAESVRITLFPAPTETAPKEGASAELWRAIGQSDPDLTTSQRVGPSYQSEGPLGPGRLIVRMNAARTDLIWAASDEGPPNAPGPQGPATLGDYGKAIDDSVSRFEGNASRFIGPLSRVALGVVLVHRVPDVADGYRLLARLLPGMQLDPEGSSDFLYQINRRRSSTKVNGILINRVSKWSVQTSMLAAFLLDAMGSGSLAQLPGATHHAVRLELDINTGVGRLVQDSERFALLRELKDLAVEIATRGDVK